MKLLAALQMLLMQALATAAESMLSSRRQAVRLAALLHDADDRFLAWIIQCAVSVHIGLSALLLCTAGEHFRSPTSATRGVDLNSPEESFSRLTRRPT